MFGTSKYESRVILRCVGPKCSTRRASVPRSVYETAHTIECDRCGLPMIVIGASAGVDPKPDVILFFEERNARLMYASSDALPVLAFPFWNWA